MPAKLSFRPLVENLLADWVATAEACPWAHVKALDESYLRSLLAAGRAGACVLLYEDGRPAAVFSAEPVPLPIAFPGCAVRAEYAGLFVAEHALGRAAALAAFLRGEVFARHFRRTLGAHLVVLILPPTITVAAPRWAVEALPGKPARTRRGILLYADLRGDPLARLGKGARYEARRGLKALEACRMISGPGALEGLCALEADKAARLGSKAVPRSHLARVLASPFYRALAVFEEDAPRAGLVYSLYGRVATFHFNASSECGQKKHLNKGLLACAMADARSAGAEVFVLGDGGAAVGQLGGVAYFKNSFATGEVDNLERLYPLSLPGGLFAAATALKRWLEIAGG